MADVIGTYYKDTTPGEANIYAYQYPGRDITQFSLVGSTTSDPVTGEYTLTGLTAGVLHVLLFLDTGGVYDPQVREVTP